MLKSWKTVIILITTCLLISSCNYPISSEEVEATVEELDDIQILATTVAQTLSVMGAQIEQQQSTQTPEATSLPTSTPTEEVVDNSQAIQNYTYNTTACYSASTVSETIYDHTEMEPDEDFTKTWTMLNAGSCSWYSGTQLVFVSGYQLDGDSPQYITDEISPGESVTFSVDMEAPSSEGTYTGYWELQTSDGTTIATVWVTIVVDDDVDFSVNSVSFSSKETYSGSCPYTYSYKAYITTSDEGEVVYYFTYSDGSSSSAITLDYDEADTQTVSGSWTLNGSGDYWVNVYIQEPNNQTFGSAELSLTCIEPTNTPTTVPTATAEEIEEEETEEPEESE